MKNPTAGGAEAVTENIVRGLASLGHDVTYFTSAFPGSKKEEKLGRAHMIREGSMYTVYLHAARYLRKHKNDFDFVIESVSAVPFFTPLYFDEKKIMIIPHHIVGRVIFKELPLHAAIPAYSAESLIPHVYKGVRFVAVSNTVKKELIDFGINPKDIEVYYFGAFGSFNAKSSSKYPKPTLITVARLMKYKRVDMLLDVLKRVENARLIVVGSGKELHNLKNYAKKIGVENRVEFTGFVDEKRKAQLVAKSWIFITASEREGFGISALEAELSGTPVVAFGIGGLNEAVKDGYSGYLVREGDVDTFAKKVALLLKSGKLRAKMSRNSIDYAKTFDPDKAVGKLDRHIRNLAD